MRKDPGASPSWSVPAAISDPLYLHLTSQFLFLSYLIGKRGKNQGPDRKQHTRCYELGLLTAQV